MSPMRLSILFAIGLTIALSAAAPASAGTVCQGITGSPAFFAADVAAACPGGANGPSEVNALSVSTDPAGNVVFTDTNPVADGDGPGGCTVSGNVGTCPPNGLGYSFNLGADDDSATVGAVAGSLLTPSTGGPGADHLIGGPLADVLGGGAGDDTIEGGAGDDTLSGGDDVDTIHGGAGSD